MANITSYKAPDLALHPSETGINAIEGAARRGGAFFNTIADDLSATGQRIGSTIRDAGDVALQSITHQQISKGAATGTEMAADIDSEWNEVAKNADPNDPTVRQKFLEQKVEPRLQEFLDGFSTEDSQKFAEQFVDRLRNHLSTKTAADMSTLAGEAIKVNVAKTVNSLGSMVANDPSSLSFALDSVDHTITAKIGSSPTLDAETAARVHGSVLQEAKQNIVKAAVVGMITKNPNVDLDAIQQKYGEYINGTEMRMFQKAAQTQAKANALVEKQAAIAQRQIDDQNVHAAATKTMTDNVTFDQNGQPIVDKKFFEQALDIAKKYPNAPAAAETVRTMFNWGEAQQNKEAKVVDDPTVKSDLMTRMFSPDKATTTLDLMKARAEGKISDHTFQSLHGLVTELEQSPIKGPVWQDTISAVKGELVLSNVGLPGKDIAGEVNYANWAQTFIPKYLAMSRAGTLPPNALDVKDPNSMISQSMAPYKRTVAQRAQDYMSSLGGMGGSPAAAPPTVTTKAQFDALASGTTYIGADGKTYRKP